MSSLVRVAPDAVAVAEAIRNGERSPVDVVEDALARIAEANPSVNACTFVLGEEARSTAAAAARALAHERPVGPLHGVPVAIKDHIWVKGVPTTLGSAACRIEPTRDAVVVERLRDAGAIILAKTATTEFSWGFYGVSPAHGITRNPVDPSRTTSGSSAGSAAAVAAGMVPIALGSDAGGSIRIPASFCGIAGFKPSHGMYPRGPGWEIARSVNCLGPMARSIRDLRLLHGILTGPDASDDQTLPRFRGVGLDGRRVEDLRVAWSLDLGFAHVDEPVRAAFLDAIRRLRSAGWQLEEAHPETGNPWDPAMTLYLGEAGAPPEGREHLLGRVLRDYLAAAAKTTAVEYYEARVWHTEYAEKWDRFFADFDVILTPSAALPPFPADPQDPEPVTINGSPIDVEEGSWGALSFPANLAKAPALTVPVGSDATGLPMGLQVMTRRFSDDLCLDVGEALEHVLGSRT
jgi:Asp-tRNA(Asn)/Glu-tRNA(Gln) amidotransferase A subunit family amidase